MMPEDHDGMYRQAVTATELTDHELDELLGAYALNSVDDGERVAVDRYLARSPRARAEVADHLLVASALGSSPADAPVPLWDRIADRLDDRAPAPSSALRATPRSASASPALAAEPRPVVVPFQRPKRSFGRAFVGLASAAAAIIAIGFLGFELEHQNQRIAKINTELAAAQAKNSKALTVEALMSAPGTKIATLAADGHQLARIVLGKDGRGFLVNTESFHLRKGEVLQLWGVQNDKVISLGVMSDRVTSVPVSAAGEWSKFVLTAEQSGGVVASDGPALAAGSFPA
jgi:Anti-sigma-K factor rskA